MITTMSAPGRVAPDNQLFKAYAVVAAAWFTTIGLMTILLPAYAVAVLHQSADRVGLVQAAITAPTLLFLIFGGIAGDYLNLKTVMVVLPAAAAFFVMVAAYFVPAYESYVVLLAYAVAIGTLGAFFVPAREAMLPRVVAADRIAWAVTIITGLQLGVQLVAGGLAAAATVVGYGPVFLFQAGILLLGSIYATLLPNTDLRRFEARGSVHLLKEALVVPFGQSRELTSILVCGAGVGICFFGSVLVLIPMAVTQRFSLGVMHIALANTVLTAGTLVGISVLLLRGDIPRPGRMLMSQLLGGGLILSFLATSAHFATFLIWTFVFGMNGAVIMTLCRALIIRLCASESRARSMATFQMGFIGGSAIGSYGGGFAISQWGCGTVGVMCCCAMAVLVAGSIYSSRIWTLTEADCEGKGNSEGGLIDQSP
jgi:MFS family permease